MTGATLQQVSLTILLIIQLVNLNGFTYFHLFVQVVCCVMLDLMRIVSVYHFS